MTQSSFDNVRRRCSPLLRSTDGRQSQRQRDYATVEASGEIDLERPWVYTDAEIADLAARVRWAQIDLAARERWAHIENDEAFEVLKSLHDPLMDGQNCALKILSACLRRCRPTCFGRCSSILGRTATRLGRSKKNCCGCFDITRAKSQPSTICTPAPTSSLAFAARQYDGGPLWPKMLRWRNRHRAAPTTALEALIH